MRHLILSILAISLSAFISCSTESASIYTLTTNGEPVEGGTVSQSDSQAEEGKSIQVTAIPYEHWEFTGWSGDLTGTNEMTVNVYMDKDRHIVALFEKVEYPLTVTVEGNGTVKQEIIQSKSTDYKHGTLVGLTAEPDIGWKFVEWRGDVTGTAKEVQIKIDQEKNVEAIFQIIYYDLTVKIKGEGKVEQEVVVSKVTEYSFETTVQLIAIPEFGWEFTGWSGDLDGSNPEAVVTIDKDLEVTANFKLIDYTLTIHVLGQGSVTQNGVQVSTKEHPFGTQVNLQATEAGGWLFAGWEGDIYSRNRSANVVIDRDKTIYLHYRQQPSTWQILPLGDSITHGTPYAYRYELYHKLTASSFNFRYVGSMNNNPADYPGVWDTTHEGRIGIHTYGVRALLSSWLNLYTPDMALIHLGTNDIFEADIYPYNLEKSISNMESIIDQLRSKNPVIRIYLATIIPIGADSGSSFRLYQERRLEWNAALQNIANRKRTDVSPIYIVNMENGFTESDLEDGVHPTAGGAEKMAQRWHNTIIGN